MKNQLETQSFRAFSSVQLSGCMCFFEIYVNHVEAFAGIFSIAHWALNISHIARVVVVKKIYKVLAFSVKL